MRSVAGEMPGRSVDWDIGSFTDLCESNFDTLIFKEGGPGDIKAARRWDEPTEEALHLYEEKLKKLVNDFELVMEEHKLEEAYRWMMNSML